jgi:hypothetical protein
LQSQVFALLFFIVYSGFLVAITVWVFFSSANGFHDHLDDDDDSDANEKDES